MKLRKHKMQDRAVYTVSTAIRNGNEIAASFFPTPADTRIRIAHELRLLREKLRKFTQ